MEAKKSSDRSTFVTSHPSAPKVLVRMGNHVWVAGEGGPSAASVSPKLEKVVSLSAFQSAAVNPVNQPIERESSEKRGQEWWTRIHKYLDAALDAVLNRDRLQKSRIRVLNVRSIREDLKITGWYDGLRIGAIVGLMLGCVGLIFAHQTQPAVSKSIDVVKAPSVAVAPSLAPTSILTLPAVHIYALEIGPFQNKSGAVSAASVMQRKGYAETLVHIKTRGWSVVNRVAVQAVDLISTKLALSKVGLQLEIHAVTSGVRPIAALSTSTRGAAQITQWLSYEVAALNALTATASDGAVPLNARVALQAATKNKPSVDIFNASGHGEDIASFSREIEDADAAVIGKRMVSARQHVIKAYSILLNTE